MNEMTMYEYVFTRCRHPEDTAIWYLGRKITYEKFLSEVETVAANLARIGVKRGDTVTLALPNIPQAVIAFYAVSRLGAVANMVHPLVPPLQFAEYMEDVNSRVAFVFNVKYAALRDIFEQNGYTVVLCGAEEYMPAGKSVAYRMMKRKELPHSGFHEKEFGWKMLLNRSAMSFLPPLEKSDGKAAVLMHSGGTTGSPKTVMMSDAAMNYQASIGKDILSVSDTRGKGMLAVLPMFHIFGLSMGIHIVLTNGCNAVLVPEFRTELICQAMRRTNVNYWIGVPLMYDKITQDKRFCNRGRRNVEFAFCGGDSMPREVKERFDRLVREGGGDSELLEGYGLTESMICVVNGKSDNRFGSVGKPVLGARVRIADPETGADKPTGELGELWVNAPMNMLGYYGDEKTSASVLTEKDGQTWVHTGDFGCADAEGYLYFKQRLKRIVKVNGIAVFPTEIEETVLRLAEVRQACAIGIPHVKAGQTVKLFVRLNDGGSASADTERIILNFLSERLIKWAVPRVLEFVEEFPLTAIGKIDFRALEKRECETQNTSRNH